MSQRYKRMADRLGIETTRKNLRHYSATELIGAGVNVRTGAGRLGHGGGGATTLRVNTPWTHTSELPQTFELQLHVEHFDKVSGCRAR
ncbi:MAG: hypothetical protein ACRDPQ_11095 [Nocardioidaceae bacterium]